MVKNKLKLKLKLSSSPRGTLRVSGETKLTVSLGASHEEFNPLNTAKHRGGGSNQLLEFEENLAKQMETGKNTQKVHNILADTKYEELELFDSCYFNVVICKTDLVAI